MRPKSATPHNLICRVLWLYYVQQINQREIAELLGLSRVKVVRLLKQGRELGLVEIQIKSDHLFLFDLEMELAEKTGLHRVWVVPSGGDASEAVGAGAVYRFQQALMEHEKIAIGSGRTYYAMGKHLPTTSNVVAQEIVSLGAFDTDEFHFNPRTLGHLLTSKTGVDFFQVKIPAFSDSPEVIEAIRKSQAMKDALKKAESVDISFTSVGAVASSRYLYYTRVSDKERKRLIANGAVAEMDGNFFDAAGQFVEDVTDNRMHISLPSKSPVILVAGGSEKAEAIAAVLRSGYLSELVIDEDTARTVLSLLG